MWADLASKQHRPRLPEVLAKRLQPPGSGGCGQEPQARTGVRDIAAPRVVDAESHLRDLIPSVNLAAAPTPGSGAAAPSDGRASVFT